MPPESATIFIVDDDEAVRNGLALLLESSGYATRQFADANSFLSVAKECCNGPACILLDQRMPGMTGLELQNRLGGKNIQIPIIFLSGHATVPTAVQAIQDGAVDFLEKPIDSTELLSKIEATVQRHKEERDERAAVQACLDSLTRREREVLDHIAAGLANKVIAQELGISERTVELHRAHVMQKFRVRNIAQLLRLLRPQQT